MAEVFDENELNELEERLVAAGKKHGLDEDLISGLNPIAEFGIGNEFVLLRRFQGESDSWELSDGTRFNVAEGEVPEELLKEIARRGKTSRPAGKKKTSATGAKRTAQGTKKAAKKPPTKRLKK